MIQRLNLFEPYEAHSLLQMQYLSYRVEADLIAFDGIPALKDTIHCLQQSNETFYRYFRDMELRGAVSYTRREDEVEICRLVVHPDSFRQGIARTLMENVLSVEQDASRFTVSTGQRNLPAVRLYEQFGFVEIGVTEVAYGIFAVHFEKTIV